MADLLDPDSPSRSPAASRMGMERGPIAMRRVPRPAARRPSGVDLRAPGAQVPCRPRHDVPARPLHGQRLDPLGRGARLRHRQAPSADLPDRVLSRVGSLAELVEAPDGTGDPIGGFAYTLRDLGRIPPERLPRAPDVLAGLLALRETDGPQPECQRALTIIRTGLRRHCQRHLRPQVKDFKRQ